MTPSTNSTLLRIALVAFGAVFCLVYPLAQLWPSGWMWHGDQGAYYFQMICGIYATLGVFLILASRNPAAHTSLISFTIWSSVVHAGIMAVQVFHDGQHEWGHFLGDVPALLLVAAGLGYLKPAALRPSR